MATGHKDRIRVQRSQDLTVEGLERLSEIIRTLATKTKNPSMGRLSAEIFMTASYLKDAQPGQQGPLDKLPKLLKDLDRACCWKEPHPFALPYSILSHLAEAKLSSQRYELVKSQIIESMEKLFSENAYHADQLIAKIDTFNGWCGIVKPVVEERQPVSYLTPPDRADVKRKVYDVLRQHLLVSCRCFGEASTTAPREHHMSNLLLEVEWSELTGDDAALFNMLFSTPMPTNENPPVNRWQDVRLVVPRSDDVSFQENNGMFQVVKRGHFCSLITESPEQARLYLRVYNEALQRSANLEPLQQVVAREPGITLSMILQTCRLTPRMKAILGYILAQSVWQFYDSDWLKAPWTSRTIQFMKYHTSLGVEGEPEVFPSKPYYSILFNEDSSNTNEAIAAFGDLHRYPRVRDLGVMLTEIGLGRILTDVQGEPNSSLTSRMNTIWITASEHSNSTRPWINFDYPKYRTAVMNSLNPRLFDDAPYDPNASESQTSRNLKRRRKIFYTSIVQPLEQLVQGTGWKDTAQSMDPLQMVDAAPSKALQAETHPTPNRSNGAKTMTLSKQWIERIGHLNKRLGLIVKGSRNRVRIAILDTGCSAECSFFDPMARMNRLKGWKDWVDGKPKPEDVDGHGTYLVSLAMTMAPTADIYVARVARDSSGLAHADANVAEAIEWASSQWNADIISMSFGFEEAHFSISEAIMKALIARRNSVLFFAAAANYGLNSEELFPARDRCVISIRATNARGQFQDFNPPVNPGETLALGTLGLDVPSEGLGDTDEVCRTGTSVATVIAVGLAAIILGYVEKNAARPNYHDIRHKVRHQAGMLAVFRALGQPAPNREELYVAPWALSELNEEDRWAFLTAARS